MTRWGISIAFLVLMGCAREGLLPEMQAGETGRVTKIIDGDALVLDTGQSVRLVSILAPTLRARDRSPDPYADESARMLEDLALGRRVRLFYPGLTRDRYDRALAHVVTIDDAGSRVWLNRAMVERGGARVRLYPSTAQRGQDLLDLEDYARRSGLGLWSQTDYRIRAATEIGAADRGFILVEGVLGAHLLGETEGEYRAACVRALRGTSVRLRIRPAARTVCGLMEGTPVRLRGWLSDHALELAHAWHAERIAPS